MANRDFELEMRMKADFQSADRASERTVDNLRKMADASAQANAEMGAMGSGAGAGGAAGIAEQTAANDALTASLGRNALARQSVEAASRATQQSIAAEMGLIRDLQERLDAGANSFDDLADTEQMLDRAMARGLISAEEYDEALGKLNDEQARLSRESEKSGRAIDSAIGRYDKASAGLKRLQVDEAKLKDAVDRGRISREAYNRAMEGIGRERAKLMEIRDGASQAANSMRGLSMQSLGVQRNLSQLVTYGVTGQWQMAGNQIIQLGNQAGVAGALFTGAGLAIGATAAVVGLFAVAAVQAYKDQQQLERALIATGNAAGATAGQLAAARDQVGGISGAYGAAQTAVAALAGSGKIAADSLQTATQAAVDLSTLTGESIESTTQKIIKLAEAPSATLVELNKQYNFLTAEVYEHVLSLEAQGRATDAAKVAVEEFGRVHEERIQEAMERAGSLERAWIKTRAAIARAWQDIKNIGRDDAEYQLSIYEPLLKQQQQMSDTIRSGAFIGFRNRDTAQAASDAEVKRIQAVIGGLKEQKQAVDDLATGEAFARDLQNDGVKAVQAINRELEASAGKAAKAADETKKLAEQFRALQVSNPGSDLLKGVTFGADGSVAGGAYEKALKGIQDRYKDRAKGGSAKKTDGQKAEEAALRELENLQKQIALLNTVADGQDKVTEAARIRYELEDGAFKSASESVKQQLLDYAQLLDSERANVEAKKEAAKALEELKKSYEQVRQALRTPAEVALETAIEQVNVLNKAFAELKDTVDQVAYDEAMARIVSGAFTKPPEYAGLAPEVGGAAGEIGKTFKAEAELEKWHADQLARLAQFRAQKLGVEADWNAQEEALTAQHQAALQQIESARQQAMLMTTGATFGQLADIAKAYGGEQSRTYRALFALSKGFAIAQAAVALAQNVAEASKMGFPQNIPMIAGAFAQGAQIASLLSGANFNGGEGFATGGHIRGPGTGTSDSIPIMGSDYEFMTRAAVVRQPGALPFLEDFNRRGMAALTDWRNYADGGLLESRPSMNGPNWDRVGASNAAQPAVNNKMGVYVYNDIDQLRAAVFNHPSAEKYVVAIAGQNGNAIKAEW